jgi:hypothetical protein
VILIKDLPGNAAEGEEDTPEDHQLVLRNGLSHRQIVFFFRGNPSLLDLGSDMFDDGFTAFGIILNHGLLHLEPLTLMVLLWTAKVEHPEEMVEPEEDRASL